MILCAIMVFLLIRRCGETLVAPPVAQFGAVAATAAGAGVFLRVLVALAAIIILGQALAKLFARIYQPPVIGEVLAGILLGPSLLGPQLSALVLPPSVAPFLGVIAQLGVVLYMFIVGLEIPKRLCPLNGRRIDGIRLGHLKSRRRLQDLRDKAQRRASVEICVRGFAKPSGHHSSYPVLFKRGNGLVEIIHRYGNMVQALSFFLQKLMIAAAPAEGLDQLPLNVPDPGSGNLHRVWLRLAAESCLKKIRRLKCVNMPRSYAEDIPILLHRFLDILYNDTHLKHLLQLNLLRLYHLEISGNYYCPIPFSLLSWPGL